VLDSGPPSKSLYEFASIREEVSLVNDETIVHNHLAAPRPQVASWQTDLEQSN
jgi:hypothetical protein